MISSLLAGLSDADKTTVRSEFNQSSNLREQLVTIFRTKKEFDTTRNQFSNPNWSEFMAYEIGYSKACEDIIKFLSEPMPKTKEESL